MEDVPLISVVDELLMLVSETAQFQRNSAAKAVLDEASRLLIGIGRRLDMAKNRYVVGILGLTNVGKSTLLNALLGGELAPRRNGPCTAAPIEFLFGEQLQVSVHYRESFRRPTWACVDVLTVSQRLAAVADDAGAESARSIRKIEVSLPLPLLASGLVIADTPGFGAAQTGDSEGSHETAVKQYLREEVSQVFWVVLAEQGIGKREMAFRDRLFSDVCDDVVVTGCEDWEQPDRNRFRERFAESFGQRLPAFHFVSGLEGLRARSTNDVERLESAGITALEQRIRELAEPSGRVQSICQVLLQLADDLQFWARQFMKTESGGPTSWWRPDSWLRWQKLASHSDLGQELSARLEVLA